MNESKPLTEAKTAPKTAPKPRPSRAKPTIRSVTDCTFANAVKVGQHQLNYITSKTFDIKLEGDVMSIRKKDWKPSQQTVNTTLSNVIYWR